MVFEFAGYRIDIDPDVTQRNYAQLLSNEFAPCSCPGCTNYRAAMERVAHGAVAFLRTLGIEPDFPDQLSTLYTDSDGFVHYEGVYTLCGRLLDGEKPFIYLDCNRYQIDQTKLYHATDDHLSAYFEKLRLVVHNGFAEPTVQMCFFAQLPWVLEGENPYNR